MKGTFFNYSLNRFETVNIHLTKQEYFEMIMSCIKSFCFGGCPADYMSIELESILCGGREDRYTKLRKP